jgi:hypothetical protein
MATQKVISMKQTTLVTALLFFLASPASLLAQEAAPPEIAPEAAPGAAASAGDNPGNPCPRHGKGMMHHGKGPHGSGHGGMQHGGGHGKGRHAEHQQVVQRLDLIDARLAKIEAMLETLIRR